jgi:hypothetical protein
LVITVEVVMVAEVTEVDMVVEIMGMLMEIISKAGGNIHLLREGTTVC